MYCSPGVEQTEPEPVDENSTDTDTYTAALRARDAQGLPPLSWTERPDWASIEGDIDSWCGTLKMIVTYIGYVLR